jgi:AcrR family transcriptional regulator
MARKKDGKKPAQIIDAAFSVFGEIGYDATLIKHIALRAGVSSGTIYTYFGDKKDLFRATVDEGWNRFLAQIREIVESKEPTGSRMKRFIDVGFGSLKHYLPLLRGMLFESSQMNMLQGKLEQFCGLVEKLVPGPRRRPVPRAVESENRRSLIRVTVFGVLFSAALAEPSRVDAEIDRLRRMIALRLSGE